MQEANEIFEETDRLERMEDESFADQCENEKYSNYNDSLGL